MNSAGTTHIERQQENISLLLSAKEVAALMGITVRTVWRLVQRGNLWEPIRITRHAKWHRVEIEDWIQRGCPPTPKRLNQNPLLRYDPRGQGREA